MSVKIYGVNLKDVRLSKDLNNPEGPGFWIDTLRNPSGKYPMVVDWDSSSEAQFNVNFGQRDFIGDPLGFEPFDPDFDHTLWFGNGAHYSNGDVVPSNLSVMYYGIPRYSGKFYYEINYSQQSNADAVGFMHPENVSGSKDTRAWGLAISYIHW